MRLKIRAMVAGLAVLLMGAGAAPVLAHHSFSAEFDSNLPADITGTITRVEWINPHVQLYLDVNGENGQPAKWKLECGPTIHFHAAHLKETMFPVGQVIKVHVDMAKDGTKNFAWMSSFTFVGGPYDGKSYSF